MKELESYPVPPDIRAKQLWFGYYGIELIICILGAGAFSALFIVPFGISHIPLIAIPIAFCMTLRHYDKEQSDRTIMGLFIKIFKFYFSCQTYGFPIYNEKENVNAKNDTKADL